MASEQSNTIYTSIKACSICNNFVLYKHTQSLLYFLDNGILFGNSKDKASILTILNKVTRGGKVPSMVWVMDTTASLHYLHHCNYTLYSTIFFTVTIFTISLKNTFHTHYLHHSNPHHYNHFHYIGTARYPRVCTQPKCLYSNKYKYCTCITCTNIHINTVL